MKKIFKSLLLIAAPAFAVLSCAKENIQDSSEDAVIVSFTASEFSTKSHFGEKSENTYPTLWSVGQQVSVIYGGNASTTPIKVDITPSPDFKSASFSQEFVSSQTANSHNFYFASPADATLGFNEGRFNLSIPSAQTPIDGSCDERAQIAVASHISKTFDTEINLQFEHATAYGCLSVTLPTDAGAVSSIALTASQNFAGRYFYSFETKSMTENSASATITLNTSKTSDIFFGCAPLDLTGETLDVVVTAANGTYERTIDFSKVAAPLKFEAGRVSKFTVGNFVKKTDDEVYTLVTDASMLKIGDKVIITASDYDFAISTTQNTNNRGRAAITKKGNSIVNPGNDVQVFTLESGSKQKTFAFNTGAGYIYAASSSKNLLKTQAKVDDNASWSISFSETGLLTIKANGTNSRNILKYNDNETNGLVFSCYNSGQKNVAIYSLSQDTGSLPVGPTIVMSATEASLAFDDENVHEISATVSGNEGEVSCAAYDDENGHTESQWLIASYENGKIIYSAVGKNETASVRTAYIIVSAKNNNVVATKVVKVTQANSVIIVSFSMTSFDGWNTDADISGKYYQLINNEAFIESPIIKFTKILSIKTTARTYGGPNSSQKIISITYNGQKIGEIQPTSSTLTEYELSDISVAGNGKIKFSCPGASSNKGSGISAITISYQ